MKKDHCFGGGRMKFKTITLEVTDLDFLKIALAVVLIGAIAWVVTAPRTSVAIVPGVFYAGKAYAGLKEVFEKRKAKK